MPIDPVKHEAYWRGGAEDEFHTASLLIEHGRYKQGLFWGHLVLEKALKALVTRATGDIPPFIHDLVRLAELAGLDLAPERRALLLACNRFCIEGRYERPEIPQVAQEEAVETWNRIKEMMTWLLSQ